MKFAVIATSGTQYQVQEGKEILVDRIEKKEGDVISFDAMLLVDDKTIKIGKPTVSGVSVKAKVKGHERGDKIRVSTFTAKSRNRRVRGYRHDYTRLEITAIR